MWRLWQTGVVWRVACRHLQAFGPDVVVGFGGWFCVPVGLAARHYRIPLLIHEQNVGLGRANRFLLKWAAQAALSFEATRAQLNGTPHVVTGLPIRHQIGMIDRESAARQCGLNPEARTVLILGGSQGSRPINRLVCQALAGLAEEERTGWQFIHLSGALDEAALRQAYASLGLRSCVAAHLEEMACAYALADLVVARAGASTITELARCGIPAVLIPYPHAGGHQRENARLIESIGGGVWLEEATATPDALLGLVRGLLSDERLRRKQGEQIRLLARPDATNALATTILDLARRDAQR
jgi:UDP-N-acetylglucosamine--N-acetylmuramyl-(pentapeptide) pyrophosphoryl-undecaprenol N-acetylglucosamine transferase